ncbi:MAG: TolC family protein [Bacteroidota bacterium]|nr:TolC family protein [Bacteroidota bacterium]
MWKVFVLLLIVLLTGKICYSQSGAVTDSDTLSGTATLPVIVKYALSHQPALRQALIDEEITNHTIKSRLSEWFPQLNFNFNIQHNFQLPVSIFQGNPVQLGQKNTSSGQFSLTQTIFNRDVLLASSTAGSLTEQSRQRTISTRIDLVVNVSKAFFAVLLSKQQNVLLDDDIRRLALSQQDTYAQYKSGVTDKTDYERASVALNNARAAKKQASEALKTSLAFLKEQMGYPSERNLAVQYDTTRMESELQIDTTQVLNPENRIEYQLLRTQRSLLQSNINYNYWSFLPSLSAFGNYNLNYLNNNFKGLYDHEYPSSFIGVQLSFPIFQGGKRYQEIRIAQLELSRSDFDIANLRDIMNTQYTEALASYKSNLNTYYVLKENLTLANDVYNTIQLQYRAGVKTYLDVITAETDLRTTQINYINALFQVLSSKLDVQRALGTIHY